MNNLHAGQVMSTRMKTAKPWPSQEAQQIRRTL
jgi:hypothetical protein